TTKWGKILKLLLDEIKSNNANKHLIDMDLVALAKMMKSSLGESLEDSVDNIIYYMWYTNHW
ncbi:14453_t:CDS:2, partial [Entrophospora sp. SA101]